MTDLAGRSFRRILLIKPSSAGDILHALPVARALRATWPEATLEWLVGSSFIDLLEAEPSLTALIPFDRRHFAHVGRRWRASSDFARFVTGLRRRDYDLVIDLQGLFRSGFLARAAAAPVRIGFRDAREFSWLFYTHFMTTRQDRAHAVDRNLEALALLGVNPGEVDMRPALRAEDRSSAAALLAERSIAPRAPYALIAPGTRWETKQWSVERFGRVAARLADEHGLPTLLVGGAGDRSLARLAVAASGNRAHDLSGRTSLRALAALVESARLVITADSFPMHLAAAYGRPLVALFGPTHPGRTGPYGALDRVVRLDLPCSPCYLRNLRDCPHQHRCMNDLDVERVMAEARLRLASVLSAQDAIR